MALRRPRLARTDAGRPQRELGEVDTVVSASRHASRSVPTKHGLWLAGDGRLEEDNEKKKLRELERDRARPWSVVVMVNRAAALARIYIPCQRDDAIRRLHRWPCLCRGRTRWGRWATTRDGASTEALPARTTASPGGRPCLPPHSHGAPSGMAALHQNLVWRRCCSRC
jgi:hypothetical protein